MLITYNKTISYMKLMLRSFNKIRLLYLFVYFFTKFYKFQITPRFMINRVRFLEYVYLHYRSKIPDSNTTTTTYFTSRPTTPQFVTVSRN